MGPRGAIDENKMLSGLLLYQTGKFLLQVSSSPRIFSPPIGVGADLFADDNVKFGGSCRLEVVRGACHGFERSLGHTSKVLGTSVLLFCTLQ